MQETLSFAKRSVATHPKGSLCVGEGFCEASKVRGRSAHSAAVEQPYRGLQRKLRSSCVCYHSKCIVIPPWINLTMFSNLLPCVHCNVCATGSTIRKPAMLFPNERFPCHHHCTSTNASAYLAEE